MKKVENCCIRTQSRTKEFWRLCRYSWNLKTSALWDRGPKGRENVHLMNLGWDCIYCPAEMTQNIELSNQTLLSQRPFPVSRFMNNFNNTGGTSEAGRGLGPWQQLTKSFFSTSGLALPSFPLEISKNRMWLWNFHRRELVWFWNISTLYSDSYIVTQAIHAPCIHRFPYLFTINNPKHPGKPGTFAKSTP